jgi:hypothetical protein
MIIELFGRIIAFKKFYQILEVLIESFEINFVAKFTHDSNKSESLHIHQILERSQTQGWVKELSQLNAELRRNRKEIIVAIKSF